MPSKMTKEQVEDIAKLCALNLSGEEVETLSKMFSDTLDYVAVLEELDTSNVEGMYQVTGLENVFMEEGGNVATLSKEDALKNASDPLDGKFGTSAVFER